MVTFVNTLINETSNFLDRITLRGELCTAGLLTLADRVQQEAERAVEAEAEKDAVRQAALPAPPTFRFPDSPSQYSPELLRRLRRRQHG